MQININFIGCGRVGKTIATLIHNNQVGTILGIVNSSLKSGIETTKIINAGTAYEKLSDLPSAHIYFITTRDEVIPKIALDLVHSHQLKPGSIIIHCSGALSSDILVEAQKIDCYVASIHPIKSFANPKIATSTFNGTFCSFEGDPEALPVMKKIFEGIGGIFFELKKESKKKYHAAMVMANNYLTTLHYHAFNLLIESRIEKPIALKLISTMMEEVLNNIKMMAHTKALTGPIQRGDLQTVSDHLDAIKNDPVIRDLYAALGKATLSLTSHSDSLKEKFEEKFN